MRLLQHTCSSEIHMLLFLRQRLVQKDVLLGKMKSCTRAHGLNYTYSANVVFILFTQLLQTIESSVVNYDEYGANSICHNYNQNHD